MNLTKDFKILNHKGMSILEILIAVSLISLAFSVVDFSNQTERDKLENVMENIQRAIRFAKNEAVIRNRIVRLKFDLSKAPPTYSVEFSDNSDLILPQYSEDDLGREEQVELDKKNEKIEQGFVPVEEFEKNIQEIQEDILITGVQTNLTNKLVKDGLAAIYFYPTGSNDNAMISFASYEEIVTLEIETVRERFYDNYYPLGNFQDDQYENLLGKKTDEIFSNWTEERSKR